MRQRRFPFAAVVVPLLFLTSCNWTHVRFGATRTGYNPSETTISPGNVDLLTLRWSFDTATLRQPGLLIGDPVVADGRVYVSGSARDATTTSRFYARGARTGAAVWSAEFPPDPLGRGQQLLSAPAVGNGLAYVGHIGVEGIGFGTTYGGGVTGYDVRTGAPSWTSTFFAGGVSGPALVNDRVYATAHYNSFLFGSFSGLAVWDADSSGQSQFLGPGGGPNHPVSAPAVASGMVYSGSEAGTLDAVDAVMPTDCTLTPPEAPDWFPRAICPRSGPVPPGVPSRPRRR